MKTIQKQKLWKIRCSDGYGYTKNYRKCCCIKWSKTNSEFSLGLVSDIGISNDCTALFLTQEAASNQISILCNTYLRSAKDFRIYLSQKEISYLDISAESNIKGLCASTRFLESISSLPAELQKVVNSNLIINTFGNIDTNSSCVVLPDNSNNYIPSNIFSNNNKIKKIICSSQIKFIYPNAFNNCSKLEIVDLSACNNLFTIDDNAFNNCPNLTTIIFPNKTPNSTDDFLNINSNSFTKCPKLANLQISKDLNYTITNIKDRKMFFTKCPLIPKVINMKETFFNYFKSNLASSLIIGYEYSRLGNDIAIQLDDICAKTGINISKYETHGDNIWYSYLPVRLQGPNYMDTKSDIFKINFISITDYFVFDSDKDLITTKFKNKFDLVIKKLNDLVAEEELDV